MKNSTHLGTLAAVALAVTFSVAACNAHKTVDEPSSDGGDTNGNGDDAGKACCDAAAACPLHQQEYADQAACDAAGDTCREVTICCNSVYCGEDGSALMLSAERSADGREVALGISGDAYYLTCTSALRLLKQSKAGSEALVDERPDDANGAYYLDGEFHAEVVGAYGCDAIGCSALRAEAPTLGLVEYVAVGSKPAPVDSGIAGEIPDIESRPYEGALRIEADLFLSSPCTGAPFTKSIELP